METSDYKYLTVGDEVELWRPPLVIFKLLLHLDVATLASYRPTPSPYAPMYIHNAISILLDIQRFPNSRVDIDDALSEARSIATIFISHWDTTPQLELQIGEVHTMNAPASFYWRAKLSCMAALKIFSFYSADEVIVVVWFCSGASVMYPWHQIAEGIRMLEGISTPPNTPVVGEESLDNGSKVESPSMVK